MRRNCAFFITISEVGMDLLLNMYLFHSYTQRSTKLLFKYSAVYFAIVCFPDQGKINVTTAGNNSVVGNNNCVNQQQGNPGVKQELVWSTLSQHLPHSNLFLRARKRKRKFYNWQNWSWTKHKQVFHLHCLFPLFSLSFSFFRLACFVFCKLSLHYYDVSAKLTMW